MQTAKTTQTEFGRANSEGDKLFDVREGIPLVDALQQASCHLETAHSVLLIEDPGHPSVWAALHLIDTARALIVASTPELEFGAPKAVTAA